MNFELWINRNYARMIKYASAMTVYPHDLVHESYIKCVDAGFVYNSDSQTDYYMKLAISNTNRSPKWKKTMPIDNDQVPDDFITYDIDRRECIEKIDQIIRYLDAFDRLVFDLYLQGENMRSLAINAGIPERTIYSTLDKVKKIIHDHV